MSLQQSIRSSRPTLPSSKGGGISGVLALDNKSQRSRIVDIELLLTPTDENHGAVTPGPTETRPNRK